MTGATKTPAGFPAPHCEIVYRRPTYVAYWETTPARRRWDPAKGALVFAPDRLWKYAETERRTDG